MAALRGAAAGRLSRRPRRPRALRGPAHGGGSVRFPAPQPVSARDERPVSEVPRWLWAMLACALAGQVAWQAREGPPKLGASDLPPAPSAAALRLASFAEAAAAARLTMLYVQAFDLGGANELPYQKLDYARLIGWLETALALDPRSEY